MRFRIRWTLHTLWLLLLGAAVGILLYLNLHGFPEAVNRVVQEQFLQYGYKVGFQSLRLDWFSGIVAEDMVLADAKRPEPPLGRINEVALQIDWGRLLSGQKTAIRGLRIRGASISVPTPPDEQGSSVFTASDAHATLRFEQDGVIRIDQLTGTYCGVRLYVSGRIKPRTEAPPPREQKKLTGISKTLRELQELRCREPLDLYVDFDIDLMQPLSAKVRLRLHGAEARYRRLFLDAVELDLAMENGAIRIIEADVKVAGGSVALRGSYDFAQGLVDLSLQSTIDPSALRVLLPHDVEEKFRDLRIEQNPKLTLRYLLSAETGPVPVLYGRIMAGTFAFRGVEFRSVIASFENRGPLITVTNATVIMPDGQLTGHGQYHIESSDFAYEFESTLDPSKLIPLMTPIMRRWVEPGHFTELPHIVAKVRGDFVDPDAFAYDAEIIAGQCSYRGVPLEAASGDLCLRRNRLEVRDLLLHRADGELTGELTADFDRQQLTFDMRTTANPGPMAGLLGENAIKMMEPYRFGPTITATAAGFVDFRRPERVTWTADVTNRGFGWWQLKADTGHGQVFFTNNTCRIQLKTEGVTYGTNRADRLTADLLVRTNAVSARDVVVAIAGGEARGSAETDLKRQQVRFEFQSTADPHALASLLGPHAGKKLEPYQFGPNTHIQATGFVDLLQSNQTAWAAQLRTDHFSGWNLAADQLDADLALTNEVLRIQARSQGLQWWKLKADRANADILASNTTVHVRNVDAALCGGTLRGEADLHAVDTNTAFRLALDARDCDIQQFLHNMRSANTNASGRILGHLELAGTGDNRDTFQGRGNLEIADGVLIEVPVLGIFSRILNLVVPGLGSASVTKANCTFTIANQRISTDDLKFETGAAAVRSHGAIGLVNGDLDFRVEAQPLRSWPGINIVTWMFGKIFEYKVGGTIENPNWRPTRLPKEILPHSAGHPETAAPEKP